MKSLSPISFEHLLHLREIVLAFLGKYQDENINEFYSIDIPQIWNYYQVVLGSKIEGINERQLLKQKIIILDNLQELIAFFVNNSQHLLAHQFSSFFHDSLKNVIISIAVQNPELVSLYARDMYLPLRIIAIKCILSFYGTQFELLEKEDLFIFVNELVFDKLPEIRLFILNILVSRFKSQTYRHFLEEK